MKSIMGIRNNIAFLGSMFKRKDSALNKETMAINSPIKADEKMRIVSYHQGMVLSVLK
jgi:hypothetical protein